MTADEILDNVTHVREPDDNTRALCGRPRPIESLSHRHYRIGMTVPRDIIIAGRQRLAVNRAASIRDGIDTLPHPVCPACAEAFARAPLDTGTADE